MPKIELLGSGTKNVIAWKYVCCKSHSSIFVQVYIADYQSLPAKSDDSYGDNRKSQYNEELTAARPMKVHQTMT